MELFFFMRFYVKSSESFPTKNMFDLKENKCKDIKKTRISRMGPVIVSAAEFILENNESKKDEKM